MIDSNTRYEIPSISTLRLVPLVLTREGSQTQFRWLVLFAVSFFILSNFYCNNFVDIEDTLTSTYKLNDVEYLSLFSIYSLPNIIVPIFGGILIDKIDGEYAALTFLLVQFIGQTIFAIAVTLGNFEKVNYVLMLVGRFFFGLGGESLS